MRGSAVMLPCPHPMTANLTWLDIAALVIAGDPASWADVLGDLSATEAA